MLLEAMSLRSKMPWEDIHMQVNDLVRDDELLMRPHSPNVLAHLVNIEIRNGSWEMLKPHQGCTPSLTCCSWAGASLD